MNSRSHLQAKFPAGIMKGVSSEGGSEGANFRSHLQAKFPAGIMKGVNEPINTSS